MVPFAHQNLPRLCPLKRNVNMYIYICIYTYYIDMIWPIRSGIFRYGKQVLGLDLLSHLSQKDRLDQAVSIFETKTLIS